MKTPLRRTTILRSIVTTKKKAPKFAKKIAKNVALSSVVEVFFHHKAPDVSLVFDATFIESFDSFVRFLIHHI